MTSPEKIRNFSIIAHIDHGKSTLADSLLLATGAISPREFHEQMLDDMDLERERGITIKARAVTIPYKGYELNLIDTPGHIDFTYEVSKSLAACEGALLLVDATQGVEAQTITNLLLAKDRNLAVIPVLSKMDLPNADAEKAKLELVELLDIDDREVLETSAKLQKGIEEVLDAVIERIPPPAGSQNKPLRALVFDSKYDTYKGVVTYIRVVDGEIKKGEKIFLFASQKEFEVNELGFFDPHPHEVSALSTGEVGYLAANIKSVEDVKPGDTVTLSGQRAGAPLTGYKDIQPMVFCGLYPINPKDFVLLRDALAKLKLNDSSLSYEPETSVSLGMGFRCGLLGLLHMDIMRERLEREFNLELLITAPNVVYRIVKKGGERVILDNPVKLPDPSQIEKIEEPYINIQLIIRAEDLGTIMALCQDRRGIYKSTEYLSPTRAKLVYEMPLAEVVMDFYDKIKSGTSGYGSMSYDLIGYWPSPLVKLDILINGEVVDALSSIVVKESAYHRGRALVEKLKEVIPRQLFEVVVQAAVYGKIIARDSIKPMAKNVTAKCYGGDITRKRKLWDKVKEGKKRMKRFGKVEIPQEAFISILKID
ncbi:MAG: elongation factor 4 [Candidatus Omnitrophica bacterium]|nr:elongation factor 4 [Candidatus Omnitrophota bacterium]